MGIPFPATHVRVTVLAAAALLLAGDAAASQNAPAPDPRALALAQKVLEAPDAASRGPLLESAAREVGGRPLREALLHLARQRIDAGDLAAAETAVSLAHDGAQGQDDRAGVAAALDVRSRIARWRGDYKGMLEHARASEALFLAVGDRGGAAYAVNGQAIGLRYLGDYDGAMALYERSLRTFEELGDNHGTQRLVNNIGVLHKLRGDLRRALEAFERSLALTPAGDPSRSDQLINIGLVHQQQGDRELAEHYARQALELDERNRPLHVPWDTAVLASLALEGGRLEEAESLYRRVLEGARRIGDASLEADALAEQAAIALARGRAAEALPLLERSRELAESSVEAPGRMKADIWMARVLEALGRPAEGEEPIRRAIGMASDLHAFDALWWAHSTLGRLQAARGQRDEARTSFEAAIGVLEEWREHAAGDAEAQHRFLEDKLEPYHALVDLLAGAGRAEEALMQAERARARTLVDVLRRGRGDLDARLPEGERREERALEDRLAGLHARRAGTTAREPRPALEQAIREARVALAAFRSRSLATRPALQLARGAAPVASLAELDELVGARSAALVYVVTSRSVHLFVLGRGPSGSVAVEHHLLPLSRQDLVRRVESFRRHLAQRDLDFHRDARRLYQDVLGPAAGRLRGKTRLVVVPDGPLWSLPFAALEPRPGRYLVEQAALSYAPSLTAWRILARARPAGQGLLALGNAVPPPAGAASLPALPEAERQVISLGRLYGPGESSVLVGRDATERRLGAEGARRGILHIAVHGETDDENPLFSHLLLTREGKQADRDGRLDAREILRLDLSARLVVLAACETGRGLVRSGEGLIGLSWAFAVAGSPNVVASQWKVDSASTTELMLGFHRGLRRTGPSADVAEALRAAALGLLRDPRYRHPFYWAAFFAIGSGRT